MWLKVADTSARTSACRLFESWRMMLYPLAPRVKMLDHGSVLPLTLTEHVLVHAHKQES
jgi:hypothetical protein